MTTQQVTTAIELVSYRLTQDVEPTKLEKINQQVNDFLYAQEGFCYRSMSQDETGTYYDIVYWQTMAHAKQAADAFMQNPACQELMAICDMKSVKMTHMNVLSEAMIDAAVAA